MNNTEEQKEKFQAALSDENFDLAFKILLPLVEKEYPVAIGQLGLMYQLGIGVNRNLSKAIEFLSKASELGDGTAAHNLGTIYSMGGDEIPQDYEKSRMYYLKARELGAQYAPDEFYE